jgi:hypothetical protein
MGDHCSYNIHRPQSSLLLPLPPASRAPNCLVATWGSRPRLYAAAALRGLSKAQAYTDFSLCGRSGRSSNLEVIVAANHRLKSVPLTYSFVVMLLISDKYVAGVP